MTRVRIGQENWISAYSVAVEVRPSIDTAVAALRRPDSVEQKVSLPASEKQFLWRLGSVGNMGL